MTNLQSICFSNGESINLLVLHHHIICWPTNNFTKTILLISFNDFISISISNSIINIKIRIRIATSQSTIISSRSINININININSNCIINSIIKSNHQTNHFSSKIHNSTEYLFIID